MQEILSHHPENRTALLRAYRHFENELALNCGDLPKNRLYFFRQTAGTSRLTIRAFTVADSVRVL